MSVNSRKHERGPDEETEYNTRVRATCTCGWKGPWRSKRARGHPYRDFHYGHLEEVRRGALDAIFDPEVTP